LKQTREPCSQRMRKTKKEAGVSRLNQLRRIISKLIFINNFHKTYSELFTDGYAFISDIDMVVFYFTKLFIVDDIGVVHPDKRRL